MTKEVMRRTAEDNDYLHRDFHGALSVGIDYLDYQFGPRAVRDYLQNFVHAYYAPLTADLRRRGLTALEDHFRHVYQQEGGQVHFDRDDDQLLIQVEACPAVTHMRKRGYPVARLFRETVATVNAALCHGTEFEFELLAYDEQTGRSQQRFYRRKR